MKKTKLFLDNSYGQSYFGSGGGFGSIRTQNAVATAVKDNGFISCDDGFAPIDKGDIAIVSCKGGDCVGSVRHWGECHVWSPLGETWISIKTLGYNDIVSIEEVKEEDIAILNVSFDVDELPDIADDVLRGRDKNPRAIIIGYYGRLLNKPELVYYIR